MKRILSFLAIIAIFLVSNCSRIPENNDPILGVWIDEATNLTSSTNKNSNRLEWIFNDAYLGRHHRYNGNVIEMQTDFKWTQKDDKYLISYPGTNLPDDLVILKESDTHTVLEDTAGNILAVRE